MHRSITRWLNAPPRPGIRRRHTRALAVLIGLAVAAAPGATSPAWAAPAASAAATVSGVYERLQADPRPGRPAATPAPRSAYDFVRLPSGKRVRVAGDPALFAGLVPGQRVSVRGAPAPAAAPRLGAASVLQATKVSATSAPSAQTTTGTQTLAVVLLRLGGTGAEPVNADEVRRSFFTAPDSVAEYFRESSWSRLELRGHDRVDGDVFGYLEIPAETGCFGEDQAGIAAAQAAGIDLTRYDKVTFLLDSGARDCWYGGWAWIGGQTNVTLHFGDATTRAIAQHELGHNLGLLHAHSLRCVAPDGRHTAIEEGDSTCGIDEYGDPFDTMGDTYNRMQFSANNKAALGWIPPSGVTTVTASGTYRVAPSEVDTDRPRNLRIPINAESYYDIDFRHPYGQYWDARVAEYPALMDGVSIRRVDWQGISLIDTTPDGYVVDGPLRVGQAFTDAGRGISIRVEAVSAEGASVRVDLGSPGGFASNYPSMTVRGTGNGWIPTPMALVADHTWQVTTVFGANEVEEFKFDMDGTWTTSFGDSDRDGVADLSGPNIPVTQGPARYEITFNDETLRYTVVRA